MAAEKFTIACPQCGEIVAVLQAHVGKKGRCGICHTVFPIVAPDNQAQRAAPVAYVPPVPPVANPPTQPNSIWNEAGNLSTPPVESVTVSYANDLLNKARNAKGTIEQEEDDSTYRFITSYGSVIGGISTIILGLLLTLLSLLAFGSMKLAALFIVMMITGGGWLVQGLNYVTYYNWKDRGGRR